MLALVSFALPYGMYWNFVKFITPSAKSLAATVSTNLAQYGHKASPVIDRFLSQLVLIVS